MPMNQGPHPFPMRTDEELSRESSREGAGVSSDHQGVTLTFPGRNQSSRPPPPALNLSTLMPRRDSIPEAVPGAVPAIHRQFDTEVEEVAEDPLSDEDMLLRLDRETEEVMMEEARREAMLEEEARREADRREAMLEEEARRLAMLEEADRREAAAQARRLAMLEEADRREADRRGEQIRQNMLTFGMNEPQARDLLHLREAAASRADIRHPVRHPRSPVEEGDEDHQGDQVNTPTTTPINMLRTAALAAAETAGSAFDRAPGLFQFMRQEPEPMRTRPAPAAGPGTLSDIEIYRIIKNEMPGSELYSQMKLAKMSQAEVMIENISEGSRLTDKIPYLETSDVIRLLKGMPDSFMQGGGGSIHKSNKKKNNTKRRTKKKRTKKKRKVTKIKKNNSRKKIYKLKKRKKTKRKKTKRK